MASTLTDMAPNLLRSERGTVPLTLGQRTTGLGLLGLGLGIAVSAILGPLVLGVIKLRTPVNIENQFVGGEIVSLGVVAPVAVVAGVLWLRGHRLAPALALAPALYSVYTYASVVFAQDYARFDGNGERFFPLYTALAGGGAAIAVSAWSQLGRQPIPIPSLHLRRTLGTILIAAGSLIGLAWAQQIRLVISGQPGADYLEGPSLFWFIKFADFGFVIPAMLATGVGLFRSIPTAIKAAYGLAGFLTCLAGSVTGMGIAMELKGDPSSQPGVLIALVPLTLGLAAVTAILLRSFLSGRGPGSLPNSHTNA